MIFMRPPLGCDTDSVTLMKTKLVSPKEELQRFQKERMQEKGYNFWILGCPEMSHSFRNEVDLTKEELNGKEGIRYVQKGHLKMLQDNTDYEDHTMVSKCPISVGLG